MSAVLLATMTLASYRLWRLLGRDEISARLRDRLAAAWAIAVRTEDQRARLYEATEGFLGCPWCLGSWMAFAVVATTAQVADVPLPALQALAAACGAGLIGERLDT